MRVVIVAACAALLLAGCKKEQPAEKPVEQVEAPKQVVEAPPKEEAPPKQDVAPAEEKVKLTAEDVEKFVKYSDARTPIVLKFAAELKAVNDKAGAADAMAKMDKARADMKAADEQAQKDAGLTHEQVQELNQLVSQVLNGRKIWKMGGGDKTIEDMKKNAAGAPAEAKADIDAQIKTMEEGVKKMRDATDARAQWGDAPVDAVLKHEEKLAANNDKVFGVAMGQ